MPSRICWLRGAVAVAFLAGLLLSRGLWLSDRSFPLCPVLPTLPPLPPPLDAPAFWALFLLLTLAIVLPFPRTCLVLVLALGTGLCLADQTRWQPWVYQYLFMLLALAFHPWRLPREEQGEVALNACRVVVAGIYFWSGLQKANASFVEEIYPWFTEPALRLLPAWLAGLVARGGWVCPFVEVAIGLGLLVPRLRVAAVALALGLHAFVLFTLGPWGHDWNNVVWPWNVAMMLFVLLLFCRTGVSLPAVLLPARLDCHALALVLFGVMPLLNFLGVWDSYLSAALYSGNTLHARLEISGDARECLPVAVQAHAFLEGDVYEVDLSDWCYRETNVPAYPARRVYLAIARSVRARAPDPTDVTLVIEEKPDLFSTRRRKTRWGDGERED